LTSNPFVQRFYPNFHAPDSGTLPFRPGRLLQTTKRCAEGIIAGPAMLLERLCRTAYRGYLVRRAARWQSPDQVRLEDDCLKLHTQSHRHSVLARFEHVVRSIDPTDT
jgi:hypothetical protein